MIADASTALDLGYKDCGPPARSGKKVLAITCPYARLLVEGLLDRSAVKKRFLTGFRGEATTCSSLKIGLF